jgi:ankyrin repeat protein
MTVDGISVEGRVLEGRITNGDVDGVKRFLNEGAFGGKPWPISEFVNTAGPALHHAAQMGRTAICELLIERGADVHFQRDFATGSKYDLGYSALHLAAHNGCRDVVELLLAHGADPNAVSFAGRRPLHLAACNPAYHPGWVYVIDLLLQAGADPNVFVEAAPDPRHWSQTDYYKKKPEYREANWFYTPLHLAWESSAQFRAGPNDCYDGHKAVKALLAAGADPFVLPEGAPRFYLTPLQTAAKHGKAADLQLLLSLDGVDLGTRSLAGRSLVQLAADRPENKALIMAAKTAKLVEGSIKNEAAQPIENQPVKRSKGMSPL